MYGGIKMNDRVIGTSVSTRNKIGRVIGVVGDGGKRKFVIALEDGGELSFEEKLQKIFRT
jgi:DNA-binding transcriptional regulator LsrR (DeoR family)